MKNFSVLTLFLTETENERILWAPMLKTADLNETYEKNACQRKPEFSIKNREIFDNIYRECIISFQGTGFLQGYEDRIKRFL